MFLLAAVPGESDRFAHEVSSLSDLLVLLVHPCLEVDDFSLDLGLAGPERLAVDVSGEEEVEQEFLVFVAWRWSASSISRSTDAAPER